MKPKVRKTSIFAKIVIVGLLIYAVFSLFTLNQKINAAEVARKETAEKVNAAVRTNSELQYQIEHSDDDEIIEDIARSELGLVEPGEKIFIDVSN